MSSAVALPDDVICFSASEMEFLAEETRVDIEPSISIPAEVVLLSGTLSAFRPSRIVRDVPLWLAVSLRQQAKCRIRPPQWLDVDYLSSALNLERMRENDDKFTALPFHYLEVATILLDAAESDIPAAPRLKSIVSDLFQLRQGKLRRSLMALDGYVEGFEVTNLSAMEINSARHLVCGALNELYKLHVASSGPQAPSQTQQPRDSSSTQQSASSAPALHTTSIATGAGAWSSQPGAGGVMGRSEDSQFESQITEGDSALGRMGFIEENITQTFPHSDSSSFAP
eukprot:ANDGO_04445.mRNA.1 DNA replication complex GINS protein PSF2